MGLLDALFNSDSYGGQGGGLLDLIRRSQMQNDQYQPSAGFPQQAPPASFVERFNAAPNAPPMFAPAPRQMDASNFDPQTFAPNQAQPIAVGNYQMPRMGDAGQFQPQQAALPPNAQPAQPPSTDISAQSRQPAQQELPPAFGGGSILGRIGNPDGLIARLTGNDSRSIAQQNLTAQYHALRQALITNGENPQTAASKAMVAVMNPEAAKTIIPELFTNKSDWGVTGEDPISGAKTYGWINKLAQTINGQEMTKGASPTGAGSVYLNKGVTAYDPSLPGDQYLQQFAPDVQSAIQAFARGDSTPTGNARKGWAENIKKWATAWGDKTGQQVNDQTFFEKKKLKTELGASGNSTMGGILDNGESSFAHLAELGKSFSDLGSISHNFPLGGYIAQGQNALGSAFGGSDTKGKLVAAKQNLTKYGQESTKFYAGTGGGVEERMAALKTVPPESSSGEEQAAYMEKEKSLMLDRLNQKFDHIRQTLGEEEGNKVIAKKLPTINQNIKTIDASIAKLRGENSATPSPAPNALPSGWSVKVH